MYDDLDDESLVTVNRGESGRGLNMSLMNCSILIARQTGWIGTVFHMFWEKLDIDEEMKNDVDSQKNYSNFHKRQRNITGDPKWKNVVQDAQRK